MNNPKEKAEELVDKMKLCLFSDGYYDAKQCALIAVDEIIKVSTNSQNSENYWRQVKQEIVNL
jgi:hypothetical protein